MCCEPAVDAAVIDDLTASCSTLLGSSEGRIIARHPCAGLVLEEQLPVAVILIVALLHEVVPFEIVSRLSPLMQAELNHVKQQIKALAIIHSQRPTVEHQDSPAIKETT